MFSTSKSIVRRIPELVCAEDTQRSDRIHTRFLKMSTLSTIESAKQLAAWTAVDKHVGEDCKVCLPHVLDATTVLENVPGRTFGWLGTILGMQFIHGTSRLGYWNRIGVHSPLRR